MIQRTSNFLQDVAPCNFVRVDQHFRGSYRLHHKGDVRKRSPSCWSPWESQIPLKFDSLLLHCILSYLLRCITMFLPLFISFLFSCLSLFFVSYLTVVPQTVWFETVTYSWQQSYTWHWTAGLGHVDHKVNVLPCKQRSYSRSPWVSGQSHVVCHVVKANCAVFRNNVYILQDGER
jgi:hypothetical protein